MPLKSIRSILKKQFNLNKTQANLILLSTITIVIQGVGFYFIDRKKVNVKLIFAVIFVGFLYNIAFYKSYAS
jgi:hypothetical protein